MATIAALTPDADVRQILVIVIINQQMYVLGYANPNPWFKGAIYIEPPQWLGSILNPKMESLLQNQF